MLQTHQLQSGMCLLTVCWPVVKLQKTNWEGSMDEGSKRVTRYMHEAISHISLLPRPWQPTWPCLTHLRLAITKVRAAASEELIRLLCTEANSRPSFLRGGQVWLKLLSRNPCSLTGRFFGVGFIVLLLCRLWHKLLWAAWDGASVLRRCP